MSLPVAIQERQSRKGAEFADARRLESSRGASMNWCSPIKCQALHNLQCPVTSSDNTRLKKPNWPQSTNARATHCELALYTCTESDFSQSGCWMVTASSTSESSETECWL